ncbi:MAG: anthranilate phosphoribosyltransferase [Dehalococcoidia bacterium]|nr:anthranilate phosphoribosyltransferase [Dehalococcoidia bacterium]MDP6782583.1 anthranilate phosphoribosyltransferase [Dehalococcoidia bacterium]
MIREAIARVVDRQDLTQDEAQGVMEEIMRGEATPSQIASFITALRMKGETPEEIAGCARSMRANSIKVETPYSDLVDTCGTGGDGTHTFNISTIVAIVGAAWGLRVAKHGNRSVSSRCGSADLLEGLGVQIDLGPEEVACCIQDAGVGFMFAPRMHPAMKHAAPSRRETGIRTIFNILGPLTNPAGASVQLLGVYNRPLTETLAQVLRLLGSSRALVVHGADGLDELSPTGVNHVAELMAGEVRSYTVDPQSLGLPMSQLSDLVGGTKEENVAIAERVLGGEKGPCRDAVLLNAAMLFMAAGRVADLDAGLKMATEAIDIGQARRTLDRLVEVSRSCSSKK